jgi:hypothetical protein
VRSTTFLFTTLCTSIQIFGVLSVQTEVQWHNFGPADATPRSALQRRAPRAPRPATSASGPRPHLLEAPHLPQAARAPRRLEARASPRWSVAPQSDRRSARGSPLCTCASHGMAAVPLQWRRESSQRMLGSTAPSPGYKWHNCLTCASAELAAVRHGSHRRGIPLLCPSPRPPSHSTPPLAPAGAGSVTPSISPAESSPEPSSRRTPPGRAVEPHDRQPLHLNQAHEPVAGESLVLHPHLTRPRAPPEPPNSSKPCRPPPRRTTLQGPKYFWGPKRKPRAFL